MNYRQLTVIYSLHPLYKLIYVTLPNTKKSVFLKLSFKNDLILPGERMFRKIILVPKSKDVQSSLDLGEYKDREVEKVVWTERTEFINLYNTNLFMDINSLCGCSIDDFEEAEIIGIENLESFLEIVNKFYKENPHEMCSDLISLAKSALKYKTGIYFYF